MRKVIVCVDCMIELLCFFLSRLKLAGKVRTLKDMDNIGKVRDDLVKFHY